MKRRRGQLFELGAERFDARTRRACVPVDVDTAKELVAEFKLNYPIIARALQLRAVPPVTGVGALLAVLTSERLGYGVDGRLWWRYGKRLLEEHA